MTEEKKQFEVVQWFSQNYPELTGHLFSVNNNTFNVKDANKKKAMGLIKGVSDLIFIAPNTGKLTGIEVKKPKSRHSTDHIYHQIKWGDMVINSGSFYIMSSNTEVIKEFITSIIHGDIERTRTIMINNRKLIGEQMKNRTILF